mgnify:CR=1 FL=1
MVYDLGTVSDSLALWDVPVTKGMIIKVSPTGSMVSWRMVMLELVAGWQMKNYSYRGDGDSRLQTLGRKESSMCHVIMLVYG